MLEARRLVAARSPVEGLRIRQDGYDIRGRPPSGRGARAAVDEAKVRPTRVSTHGLSDAE